MEVLSHWPERSGLPENSSPAPPPPTAQGHTEEPGSPEVRGRHLEKRLEGRALSSPCPKSEPRPQLQRTPWGILRVRVA